VWKIQLHMCSDLKIECAKGCNNEEQGTRMKDLKPSQSPFIYILYFSLLQKNSTKTSAPFFKEPLLFFTPSSWVWVAPSTTLTR